jgi:hypothetical protein
LKTNARITRGISNILNSIKNRPPNKANTKANTAAMIEKIKTMGAKARTIPTNKSFKPTNNNNSIINISMILSSTRVC